MKDITKRCLRLFVPIVIVVFSQEMPSVTAAKTAAFYLAFTIVGMTTAAFGPSLPSIAEATATTFGTVGALFVFQRIGYITGSLGGGRILDRIPVKYVVTATMAAIGVGLVVLPQWAAIAGVFATALFLGFAQGTAEVAANTGVVWLHGNRAGPAMNGLHLSFGVGAMLAPLAVSQSVARADGIAVGYVAMALLAFGAALWWTRLPPAESHDTSEASAKGVPDVPLVLLLSLLLFSVVAGESGFAGWIYSYVVRKDLVPETAAGYLNSAF